MKRVCNKRCVVHVCMYVRRKVQETSSARVYLCTWTRYARVSITIAMSASVLVTLDLKLNSHARILRRSWEYVRGRVFLRSKRKIAAEDLAVISVRGPKSSCIFTFVNTNSHRFITERNNADCIFSRAVKVFPRAATLASNTLEELARWPIPRDG